MSGSESYFKIRSTPEDFRFSEGGEKAILEGLGSTIIEHLGNVELGQPIRIFITNQEEIVVGGIFASCFGGWMYISFLWVDKPLRNKGYGTRLMEMAEAEAIKIGCRHAHLDTYSFEARPFYERLGYRVFASLEDYPQGYCKYFLKKQLI